MDSTIAAISTATAGKGGIGIVRVSGNEAIKIADDIFKAKNGKKLINADTHTIHYGHIMSKDGKPIDEVLVSVMKAPNTYTREDIIEINTHGGNFVIQKVLDRVTEAGAVIAEPGEFTKRAFMNGRIDLSEAEAVIDIINAENNFTLNSAVEQLNGRLSERVKEIREDILDEVAFMEAAMDDPEHIEMGSHMEELEDKINKYILSVEEMRNTFNEGRLMKEGIRTTIIGRTNAGKSSLLNLLTGTETAIVTDIEGTTRDSISEKVNIGGVTLNVTDTAGIRETEDVVESIGVKKARKHAETADLILYVIDSTRNLEDEDRELIELVRNKKTIILLNKYDLESKLSEKELLDEGLDKNTDIIKFSAKTSEGIDELSTVIKRIFALDEILVNNELVITNSRHKSLLDMAVQSLKRVRSGIETGFSEDLLFIDMMDAYSCLGKILGEEIEDDLADRIFEKFCMGK